MGIPDLTWKVEKRVKELPRNFSRRYKNIDALPNYNTSIEIDGDYFEK